MTRFDGPGESPGFLLWHTTMRWQRAIAAALHPLDLTHVQFVLLASAWWLNQAGESPNQVRLAAQAGVDVKMASEVIRRLEGKQLLTRHADPIDARARVLVVTPAGTALARRAIEVVEDVDAEFFSPVDAAPLVQAMRALAAVPGRA
ncbi:MAG: winged helix-turn-helix transcriptional regulator [Schumannella sp.]|nr:winged helix-turn-helix transcriptional regulator [Schumannella sp.]